MDGQLLLGAIRGMLKDTKSFATSKLASLKEVNPKEELDPLVRVKRAITAVKVSTVEKELALATSRSALRYLSKKVFVAKEHKEKAKEVAAR